MTVETLTSVLDTYGYWIFFGVGFAEFAGLPLASSVVLVAAGGLAAGTSLSPGLMVPVAAAGGFLADAGWYHLARWQGDRVLDTACGLTSNPTACVSDVCRQLQKVGSPYVLVAKFLPGTANLIAPAAGLAGLGRRTFLTRTAVALLGWAAVYTGLGWIFSHQVETAVSLVLGFGRYAAGSLVGLLAVFLIVRGVRIAVHRQLHRAARGGASGRGGSR